MLRLQRSPTKTENDALKKVLRAPGQSNTDYVAAHTSANPAEAFEMLLLGGVGPVDFRLRIAQAHARDDLLPSAWSHVAFLLPGSDPNKRELLHIPLSNRMSIEYPPATNAVQRSPLDDYADPKQYPNIALLSVPVAFTELSRTIEAFKTQRTVLDALELMLAWWSFVWGVGATPNPIFAELGVPSAAFAEYCSSAVGYDLVPGFPSRSSCPEAIWIAARWWHLHPRIVDATRELESDGTEKLNCISGVYDAEHYLVPVG